jgi:hypothetical protein
VSLPDDIDGVIDGVSAGADELLLDELEPLAFESLPPPPQAVAAKARASADRAIPARVRCLDIRGSLS